MGGAARGTRRYFPASRAWVIAFKYLTVIMRADNSGEGGILALLALALRGTEGLGRLRWAIVGLGIFGASMFYGDSVITPAISVLSAVEGLEVVQPRLGSYVIWIAVGSAFSQNPLGSEIAGARLLAVRS